MSVPASYGFRVRRGAAAVVLVVRLITELAATTGTTLARCWVDLKGLFMGIFREFLYRLDRAVGVEPGITRTMCELQGQVSGRVITAHGLSDTFCMVAGTGQGCNCSPNRANIDLAPLQWTLERLIQGYPLPTRGGQLAATVAVLWFADDANTAAASASAISAALSVTWMVTWLSGNEVGSRRTGAKRRSA